MLRIVPHTVPRVGRSYEHFPDGFELHLLPSLLSSAIAARLQRDRPAIKSMMMRVMERSNNDDVSDRKKKT